MQDAITQRDFHLQKATGYMQERKLHLAISEFSAAAEQDSCLAQMLLEAEGPESPKADIFILSSVESWMKALALKLLMTGKSPAMVDGFKPFPLQFAFNLMY